MGVASGWPTRPYTLPTFLAYLVVLCFERWCQCHKPHTVTCSHDIWLLPKFWAGYATEYTSYAYTPSYFNFPGQHILLPLRFLFLSCDNPSSKLVKESVARFSSLSETCAKTHQTAYMMVLEIVCGSISRFVVQACLYCTYGHPWYLPCFNVKFRKELHILFSIINDQGQLRSIVSRN